ncbi:MAG: adenylyltransferase, partial [Candidatus Thermoplasmatota archaeon]|nr:adenylyltransferase [Candidatus Thermoplasmatota archaeon]
MTTLVAPHGGILRNLVADPDRAAELKELSIELPDWDLTNRQLWDTELLLNGAFSPLEGFMTEEDYYGVCKDMRLGDGTLWPVPITLDVTREFIDEQGIEPGSRVALRHPEGMVLAILHVSSIFEPDRDAEAEQVLGTTDEAHPHVFNLKHKTNPVYIGGKVEGIELPQHHTFQDARYTPSELRHVFS